MKKIKKTLLVANIALLGFALAGCSNSSNVLASKDYKSVNTPTNSHIKSITLKQEGDFISTNSNGIIKVNKVIQSVFYDCYTDKELFSIGINDGYVYGYSLHQIFIKVSFDEGYALYDLKGNKLFESLDDFYSTTYTVKSDKQILFYKKNDDQSIEPIKAYKIKVASRNELAEKSTYEEIDINSVGIKKGDSFDNDSTYSNYSYTQNGTSLTILDKNRKPYYTVNFAGLDSYLFQIIGNKLFYQNVKKLSQSTADYKEYDFYKDSYYYRMETYLVNLDNLTETKLTNFNYWLANSVYTIYSKDLNKNRYIASRGALKIVDKNVVLAENILIDGNGKITVVDGTYAFTTSFTKLNNDRYYTYDGFGSYITDTNGKIIKILGQNSYSTRVLYKNEIFVYYNGQTYTLFDFDGNYVSNEMYKSIIYLSDDELFVTDLEGNSYIISLSKRKVDNKVLVEDDYQKLDNYTDVYYADDFDYKEDEYHYYQMIDGSSYCLDVFIQTLNTNEDIYTDYMGIKFVDTVTKQELLSYEKIYSYRFLSSYNMPNNVYGLLIDTSDGDFYYQIEIEEIK